jgi:polygalacturonase
MDIAGRRKFLQWSGAGMAAAMSGAVPAIAAPSKNAAKTPLTPIFFDVRSYGATGDGKTLDTPAVNAAIAAAAAAGGGTVVFPSGTFLCYSIHLASKVHLLFSQGSIILAAPSPLPGSSASISFYDMAEPKTDYDAYQDYGHNHWHNSLIWGENLSDFSITGPGLIYGEGLSFGADRAQRGDYPIYHAEQPGVGNKAIALKNCHNVVLRDFSVLKGGHFALLLTGVDNLTIDNLKIDTDRDGMDIDCCRNVRVSNCLVNSPWDDGICPKSSYALGYARSTDNVTITNCYVSGCWELGSVLDATYKRFAPDARGVGHTGRIKCGTESNGGFRNITISNCVFEGCQGLALETVDGALLEDIAISNITMRDIVSAPIFMRLGARLRGPQDTTKVGTLRRVLVNNLVCYNTASHISSIISGIPGFEIEDVKISDMYVQTQGGGDATVARVQPPELENHYPEPGMFGPIPATGFYIRHAKRVELNNVEVVTQAADARPMVVMEDVQRMDLINVTAPHVEGQKDFIFRNVSDTRVLQCRNVSDAHESGHIDHKEL